MNRLFLSLMILNIYLVNANDPQSTEEKDASKRLSVYQTAMLTVLMIRMRTNPIYIMTNAMNKYFFTSDDFKPEIPQLKDSKLMQFKSDYELWWKRWCTIKNESPNPFSVSPFHWTASYFFEYKEKVRKTMLLARTYDQGAQQDPILLKEHAEVTKENDEKLQSYNDALERYHTNNRVNWSFY